MFYVNNITNGAIRTHSLRTLYPDYSRRISVLTSYFRSLGEIEVLVLPPLTYAENARYAWFASAQISYAFYNNCKALKKILSPLRCKTNTTFTDTTFDGCTSLEDVYIQQLHSNIYFKTCPNLALSSVQYMVDNATNTSAITITLHSEAYSRCQADTTEYSYGGQTYIGILAYASARNITIASA